MVDLVILQSVSYVAGAIGVLLATLNYIISTRNADKARQATLFMGIFKDFTSEEIPRNAGELYSMKWVDFPDFQKKYDYTVDPENSVKRTVVWYWFDGIGVLVKKGLIDKDLVYQNLSYDVTYQWIKWWPIIGEYKRLGEMGPNWLNGFEFLAGEMEKMRREKGIKWELTPTQ